MFELKDSAKFNSCTFNTNTLMENDPALQPVNSLINFFSFICNYNFRILALMIEAIVMLVLMSIVAFTLGYFTKLCLEFFKDPMESILHPRVFLQGVNRSMFAAVEKNNKIFNSRYTYIPPLNTNNEIPVLLKKILKIDPDFERKNSPHQYSCPISLGIMNDPVIMVESSKTYDRSSIVEWLEQEGTDPLNRTEFRSGQYIRNEHVHNMIQDYLQTKYTELIERNKESKKSIDDAVPDYLLRGPSQGNTKKSTNKKKRQLF